MEQNHSLGHLSFISSALVFRLGLAVTRTFARTLSGSALASCSVVAFYDLFLASYLKVPRAKALHFLA